jgi:hypothetical protein
MSDQKSGMSKGCLIALIIAAAILAVFIALSIVCYVKRDSIMEWGLVQMAETSQKEILANLPKGVTKEDIELVVANFKIAVKEKKIPAEELQSIAFMYQEVLKDKKIDGDEALVVLEQLRKYSGVEGVPIQDSVIQNNTDGL